MWQGEIVWGKPGYYYFKGAGQKKKLLPDKENIGNVWVRKIQGIDILVIRGK